MSIEFNRRTFLKTGAAMVGASALMSLTGCGDSDSSSSHPVNKVVPADQTYDVGGIKVEFGSFGVPTQPYCEVRFYFTNPAENSSVSLYSSNFSAAYNGATLNFVGLFISPENQNRKQVSRIDITKDDGEVAVVVQFDGFLSQFELEKFTFKFHYNNKSIKFRDDGKKLLTSGVYSEKTQL